MQKTDIFRKIMWFGYENENTWHPLEVSRVNEILKLNQQGKKPESLAVDDAKKSKKAAIAVAIASDLEKLDKKYSNKSRSRSKRKKKKGKNQNRPNRNAK